MPWLLLEDANLHAKLRIEQVRQNEDQLRWNGETKHCQALLQT
jgi:hypothetical protein